ncbi:MAG: DUF2497 domain-containing protein [Hyphomicrobiaceae bacterium]
MSRSEQLPDAHMEEILASIRKIISDEEPEAFDSGPLEDFAEVSTMLARDTGGGYMHDLTRALAGPRPAAGAMDEEILDAGASNGPVEAEEFEDEPAEMRAAPVPMADDLPLEDDGDDLFEDEMLEAAPPEAAAVAVEPEPLLDSANPDDEIVLDLEDPISLGPELELAEPAEVEAAGPSTAAAAEEAPTIAVAPPPPAPVIESEVDDAEPHSTSEPVEEAAASIEQPSEPAALETAPVTTAAEPAGATSTETADVALAVSERPDVVAETMAQEDATDASESETATETGAAPMPESAMSSEAPVTTDEPEPARNELESDVDASADGVAPVSSAVEARSDGQVMGEGHADEPAADFASAEAPVPSAAPALTALPVGDDLMAAMLKPMLKEWLDANMPRIVAKAMGGKDEPETPAS